MYYKYSDHDIVYRLYWLFLQSELYLNSKKVVWVRDLNLKNPKYKISKWSYSILSFANQGFQYLPSDNDSAYPILLFEFM